MEKETPSPEEQDEVAWYVLKRPLVRPNTSYKKAVLCILLFLLVNIGAVVILFQLFRWLDVSSLLPESLSDFYREHHTATMLLLVLIVISIGSVFALKYAVIGAVRLYQRYAPEEMRRRCLFKPTCSEYTILAIQKYGVVKGLYKSYIRLFKKCKGHIYRIDEP